MKTLVKRWVAVAISLLFILTGCFAASVQTKVAAYDLNQIVGIMDNGLNGVTVDIKSDPFVTNASYGYDPYGPGGCGWYVTARAQAFTNVDYENTFNAENWKNVIAPRYGYTVDMNISPNSILCYYDGTNRHVAYVERVDGDTVTISEGGYTPAGSAHGYCIIRERPLSEIGWTYGPNTSIRIPLQGVVHLTSGGGTPVDPPTPSFTTSWQNFSSFDGLNGNFYGTISVSTPVNFTEAGIAVWQDGVLVADHSEDPKLYYGAMNMWWTPQELGFNLSEGHTYTYQFHAVANGQRYESEVYSYTTPAPTLTFTWSGSANVDENGDIIFNGEAQSNKSVTFTEKGIILQSIFMNEERGEEVNVISNRQSIEYNSQDLLMPVISGQTYTYQFYVVADGQRYESEEYQYTVPIVEPTQKQNQWTQELSIEDWDFNHQTSFPTAEALYGDVMFTYSDSENGPFTSDVPFYAGTYYVKAEVAETDEYTGLTAVTSFTIHKAEPPFAYPDLYAYYGQRLEDVELPEGMTWTQESLEQFDGRVGDCTLDRPFSVDYNPGDLDNYVMLYNQLVPVDVLPRDIADLELPQITADTNLDELSLTLDGLELVLGRDYTVLQQTNEETGEVVVIIEGTGNYNGMVSTSYTLQEESVTPPEEGNDPGVAPDNNGGNSNSTNTGAAGDNSATNDTEAESDVPQTGDNTVFSITAIAAVMLLSGCGIVIAVKQRKKSR